MGRVLTSLTGACQTDLLTYTILRRRLTIGALLEHISTCQTHVLLRASMAILSAAFSG